MKTKSMFKSVVSVGAAVAMAACSLAFTGCGKTEGGSGYTAKNTEYVIGVSGPLTGGAAVYGVAVKNAAEMAVEEINAAGGLDGVKFKFVAMDDMHDATKVSTNYAKLLEGGMQVSLGTVTTAPCLEWKQLSHEDNIFFLTPSASADAVPEFDNGYQMCFADSNQGAVAAKQVNEDYKGQTIGAFYKSDDAYSKGMFDKFKATLDSSITLKETSFTENTATDFATQIDTLKDCKFVFLPIYAAPASLFITQAKSIMSKDTVFYGCDGLDGIDSIEGFDITTVPQKVSMLSQFNSKATEGASKVFIDKYVAKYGKDTLNQFGASAYDCIYALVDAMKAIKAKGKDIPVTISASDLCDLLKEEFQGGFKFSGVTGDSVTWDANGYVNKTALKYVIKEADK